VRHQSSAAIFSTPACRACDSGVINQHIKPTQVGINLFKQPCNLICLRNITAAYSSSPMCLCNLIKRRIGNIANMQARAGVCKALGNDPSDTAGPCSYQNTKLQRVFCVSSHFSSPNI
jgi:hypothetical protein